MKKLILAASLFLGTSAFAVSPIVMRSTNTSTTEQTAMLCPKRGFVHTVVVSSANATSSVAIYNSSWTTATAGSIGPLMTTSLGTYIYDAALTNGLNYSKTGTAQIQITYDCY